MTARTCSILGCERPHRAKGLCSGHYQRPELQAHVPLRMRLTGPAEDRFWARVDKDGPGGCWVWTGARTAAGYGHFWAAKDQLVYAHRFAYQLLVGPIPEGMEPDHLCRVRHCVKAVADERGPPHLEVVTSAENTRRGVQARQDGRS